jgi:hypothetical protein
VPSNSRQSSSTTLSFRTRTVEPALPTDIGNHVTQQTPETSKNRAFHEESADMSLTDTPTISFTTTTPKLVKSRKQYDQYSIRVTYRLDRNSTVHPHLCLALPSHRPLNLSTSDTPEPVCSTVTMATVGRGDESSPVGLVTKAAARNPFTQEVNVSRQSVRRTAAKSLLTELDASDPFKDSATRFSKRASVNVEDIPVDGFLMDRASQEATNKASRKPHQSTSETRIAYLRAVASKERKLARHMPRRAPTPKPHHRGLQFHQLTPGLPNSSRQRSASVGPKTPKPHHRSRPFHRLTPGLPKSPRHRSASAGPKTPAPTNPAPIERPTVRRKKTWKKAMQNMVDYNQRRSHFPRRPTFQQPLKENITLARLETFWRIMSDLIARRKIFSTGLGGGWEYLGVCARLVNARVEEADQFSMDESDAAAKELMRQRLITYTKSGKLWLEKSALSTRLS